MVNPNRIRTIKKGTAATGPAVYWMSRDQRVADNWALIYAYDLAAKSSSPLAVVFNLVPEFLGAMDRQYIFMIEGLQQVEEDLRRLNIPMFLLTGKPEQTIPAFVARHGVGALIADFNPELIS